MPQSEAQPPNPGGTGGSTAPESDGEPTPRGSGTDSPERGTSAVPDYGTVLDMPWGEYWHVPIGSSAVPKCGAVADDQSDVSRMTRYHAEHEAGLEPCSSCMN